MCQQAIICGQDDSCNTNGAQHIDSSRQRLLNTTPYGRSESPTVCSAVLTVCVCVNLLYNASL